MSSKVWGKIISKPKTLHPDTLAIISDILWYSKTRKIYLLCILFLRKLLENLLHIKKKKEEANKEKGRLEIQEIEDLGD